MGLYVLAFLLMVAIMEDIVIIDNKYKDPRADYLLMFNLSGWEKWLIRLISPKEY